MEIIVDNEHDFILNLAPKTPAGKPSTIQPGSVVWSVVSGDLIKEDVMFPPGHPQEGTADELKQKFITGELGQSVISVEADADLGEGIRTINDNANVTVNTPTADNLGLTVELVAKNS